MTGIRPQCAAILCATAAACVTPQLNDAGPGATRIDIRAEHTGTWERGVRCPYGGNDARLTLTIDVDISLAERPRHDCHRIADHSELSVMCRGLAGAEPIDNVEELTVRLFDMSPESPQGIVYWRSDWLQYMECVQHFRVTWTAVGPTKKSGPRE